MKVSLDATKSNSWVKKARKKLGMTQSEFAAALGVTRITVTRWETCREPSIRILNEIAALMHTDRANVLKGEF